MSKGGPGISSESAASAPRRLATAIIRVFRIGWHSPFFYLRVDVYRNLIVYR